VPDLEWSTLEDLPPPTALAILFRVAMTHWLGSLPKSEALSVLRGMAEDLATEESLASVMLLRPPPEQAAVNRARREAISLFRRLLPVWLAALDGAED
jgi:hypothetical protein